MTMGRFQLLVTTLILALAAAVADAGPPVRVGIGLNFGGPGYYRPYGYPYGYPYYYPRYAYPYPYAVVAPAPVIYQAAPVVVQQGPVVATTPAYSSPAPEPAQVVPANANVQAGVDAHLQRLSNPDEGI